jgi:hypothetical protein
MSKPARKLFKVLDEDLHPALLLMFLATLGGAIRGNIQSCGIQKMIKGNALVSQIMLLMIIYVSVSKLGGNNKMNSVDTIGLTLSIFLIFTIINKNHIITLLIGVGLLFLCFILNNVLNNELKNNDVKGNSKKDKLKKKIKKIKKILQHVSIVTFMIGFILYMMKQMKERGSEFNFAKFLFGTGKCENL